LAGGVSGRAHASGAVLLAAAMLWLLVGCGGSGRSSHHPEELLGTPPAGAKYKVPDAATVSQLVQILKNDSDELDARDVAVRVVVKNGIRAGAVVVLDVHGSGRDSVFKGFEKEASGAGAEAKDKTIAGAEAKQAELKGLVATVAVEQGFALETIAPDRPTSELLLRPLLERAATIAD
jgi:hypothetical protein